MHTNPSSSSLAVAIKTGFSDALARLAKYPKLRRFSWLIVPAVAAISFMAVSQSTAPVIPPVVLSADPLYATATGDKPLLALALSVEFPTVGAQYVDVASATSDASYTNANEYLGYYDAESCYTYNNAPTESPVAPLTAPDYKRFDRVGKATSRMCNTAFPNAFSGNFLNWASSSAIDMLRLSLTGGDRYIDTTSTVTGTVTTPALTVLQRAVIPDGDPVCMWNSSNFPAKQLAKAGGTSGAAYFGAVPAAMATDAGANDIWVGNTLNKIFFGTASGGACGNTSTYQLGGAALYKGTQSGVLNTPLPASAVLLGGENAVYSFTGIKEVWFGVKTGGVNYWTVLPASGGIDCYWQGGGGPYGGINDPKGGAAKQCYIVPYAGTWTPPVSAGILNNDGFFYSRVQVCNVNSSTGALEDPRDYAFCKKYPNGNYKPAGAIQKYSDQLRLAAFGYLMDQTASYSAGGRYGGVLRAPAKYVGGKTFDTSGVDNTITGGNPNREWNENTGVFIVNPDSDATYGKSGIVTYLNQFGRTGPVPGRYKKYDPVGELHYETLRYLQGLQPSTDATSGITAAMYDGFPVTTAWVDPYGGGRSATDDYSCLKSNIVVIGDVNTHDGNRLPTASAANNIPDINYWRGIVQDFEKNVATTYTDGQGTSRTAGNPNGANNSVPSGSSTSQIMGSAYWARTHDIRGTSWTGTGGPAKQRPGLRVKTFAFDVNEYGQQTSNGTRRTSNQFFMAAKYGGFETDPSNLGKAPYNTWGNPFKRDNGTVDKYVWEDTDPRATRVGEANTYFLQSDARSVLSAFDDIFSRASTAARSIAGGAIQSKNLTQAGNTIFQGTFDTADWSGDLLAIPVSVSASNTVTISSTNLWTAATQLAADINKSTHTFRKIVVGNRGAAPNPVAAPFVWASIEQDLKDDLNKPAPAAVADALGEDRLNYLRGDISKEANPFRKRNNKFLGDIINSGVAYSGAPTTGINDSGYASFYTTNAGRTPAVFVGANDGMLHAFNATSGEELFAYIPSWFGPRLSALTNATYVNNHQSYLDGTPTTAEALVGSTWKTVLVAGTGGGGQGVFALDVTNPVSFDEKKVMWEFTHKDDADMGNVIGRPRVLKLRTSAPAVIPATYKWFAVIASGVNSYVPDSSGSYGTGHPALFLLDLSKTAGTPWSLGSNYYKIVFPVNGTLPSATTLSASKATGIANFAAVLGAAKEVKHIFAGDLHGNLWKLDFSLVGTANWDMTNLSTFNSGTPYPLYAAKDSSGNAQPISATPSIAYGPLPDTYYVSFGTGKYLEIADKSSTATQSAYMVYDNGTTAGDASPLGAGAVSGRARLKQGTVNTSTGVVSVPAFTLGRAATNANTEVIRSGWYFDYATSGERQISNGTVVGSYVFFGSLIPGSSGAGTCTAASGGGNQYTVSIATGNGKFASSTVGFLGELLVAELTGANTATVSDSTGRRIKTTTRVIFQQGSTGIAAGGAGTQSQPQIDTIDHRISWRQIYNYQDLKNAP